MILLIIVAIIFIIGILCIIKGYHSDIWSCDEWYASDGVVMLFSGIVLIFMIVSLISKPYGYKIFKIKYDTIKETITDKYDIRDATFTQQLIEINQDIRHCRELKNSKWIGIFQNQKICELELLKKE